MADTNLSAFLWPVADLLRGDFRQSDYGKVILPFTVLRRLDCVLEGTKSAVLEEFETRAKTKVNPEPFLLRKAGFGFCNVHLSPRRRIRGWGATLRAAERRSPRSAAASEVRTWRAPAGAHTP